MFDAQELRNLRQEAEINHIDFSRAKIRAAKDGGYVVVFDNPLFDLGAVLADPPSEVDARTAAIAEGELLAGLMKIQRAERYRLRTGRTFGWSQDQISRRPLSADEVAEYKAAIAHAADVKRLQRELTAVLEANAKDASANAGADELKARYGLAPSKSPAKAGPPIGQPNAVPKRARSKS
ncbi:hypothetical protein [Pseudomonas chlororaphis]